MTYRSADRRMRELVDLIYGTDDAAGDGSFMGPLFEALRPVLHFSTAVYLPIDPGNWVLRAGHAHDIEPRLVGEYLTHYYARDPYVIDAPCLKQPGRAIRFSDVADVSARGCGDFVSFMERVPYFHSVAVVPKIGGIPFAVFSVHRPRNVPDFGQKQLQTFEWFANHVARGIEYRQLRRRLCGASPAGSMVLSRNGQILSINDEARSILARLAPNRIYKVPAATGPPRIWRRGMEAFVVRSAPLPATSLLTRVQTRYARMGAAVCRLESRLKRLPDQSSEKLVVTIEPIDRAAQAASEIFGLKFAPQERRVAILLVKGYTPKQIAEAMELSLGTVREYIQACYRRVSARSAEEFLQMIQWGIDAGEK